MGKEESAKTTGETDAASENSTEETTEVKEQSTTDDAAKSEPAVQQDEKKKEDVEKLRTVIKLKEEKPNSEESAEESSEDSEQEPTNEDANSEETDETEDKKADIPASTQSKASDGPIGGSREDLEQRRNMLQTIKDFDFQIKKNQEDIGKMVEKLDGLTKDLDDLVSLYEIVSEQMNPFVGLSKVTKKRIDALENFTKEIEDIKERMGDVESVVEKEVGGIKRLTKKLDDGPEMEKIDTSTDTASEDIKRETETQVEDEDNSSEEISSETAVEPEVETPNISENDTPSNSNVDTEIHITQPSSSLSATHDTSVGNDAFSEDTLDTLLIQSLESLMVEQNIEHMINEFLLSLK